MPQIPENYRKFESLVDIVKSLRGPEGCPWDKEQTHASLTRYAIEEAFELSEAIDSGYLDEIQEELGDLLLQVVLHAEIARQNKTFDISDVIETIGQKMVRRHPHVFGDTKVSGSAEVLVNWQKIKDQEKASASRQIHFNVPVAMPALIRSQKIGEKTKKYRFDWPHIKDVIAKVDEELAELKEAIANAVVPETSLTSIPLHSNSGSRVSQKVFGHEVGHELGDLLFSIAQLARHLDLDSEQCLRQTNTRFEQRFLTMQKLAFEQGLEFESLLESQLEELWSQAKKSETNGDRP